MSKNGKYSNGGKFAGLTVKRLQLPVSSPACYSPSRQTIYINPPTFDILSNRAQDFVMCHEAGHAHNESEFGADWAGFLRFLRMGYTPKDAIEAMNESLSMSSPQQQQRFLALIYRAACYDAEVNNNPKTLNLIMSNPEFEQFTNSDVRLFARRAGISETEAADFLGMSDEKKAAKAAKKEQRQANRQAKKDAKLAKKEAKTQVILSRANKNNAKAEGIANGTYQGAGAAIKDTLNNALSTVGGIFGVGSGSSQTETETEYDDEGNEIYTGSTETKSATSGGKMKWLLIAAAVIIAVVVVVIIVKKRKK